VTNSIDVSFGGPDRLFLPFYACEEWLSVKLFGKQSPLNRLSTAEAGFSVWRILLGCNCWSDIVWARIQCNLWDQCFNEVLRLVISSWYVGLAAMNLLNV
jgi:hypothetical protein